MTHRALARAPLVTLVTGAADMNCEQARNLFDAYLNGELSPSLETELGAHRLHCADCRHQLALLEVVGHVVAADGGGQPQLDDAFTDRLLACLDRAQTSTVRPWPRRLRIGGAILAVAAAIALTFTVWFRGPEPRVAGQRFTNHVELDHAADNLVQQVESTWNQRADNAQELIQFGEMTIMQILDRLGVDQDEEPAQPFELIPESFDELGPTAPDDGIEDL